MKTTPWANHEVTSDDPTIHDDRDKMVTNDGMTTSDDQRYTMTKAKRRANDGTTGCDRRAEPG